LVAGLIAAVQQPDVVHGNAMQLSLPDNKSVANRQERAPVLKSKTYVDRGNAYLIKDDFDRAIADLPKHSTNGLTIPIPLTSALRGEAPTSSTTNPDHAITDLATRSSP
jgi:hypothetical protein